MRKILLSLLLAVTAAAFTVFPACLNGGDIAADPPKAEHICGHKCPYCGKCLSDCTDKACAEKCVCAPVTVEHTVTKLLKGTVWETPVHKFVTNKAGPKIAIVGGTHGDERAGWNAGIELAGMFNEQTAGIRGEILIIPQANIQADKRGERYQGSKTAKNGVGTVDGVKYSDLNRSFPDGRAANAQPSTIKISDAIRGEVEAFGGEYIVDLHESLHSWSYQSTTTRSLGDSLIYRNNPLFMDDLLFYYNKVYRQDGETQFTSNPTGTKGSFNYYFTNLYPSSTVFTIETNRENISGSDSVPLARRVRQQLDIISALLDMVWERVDLSEIL